MSDLKRNELPKGDTEERDMIVSTPDQRDAAARASSVILMQALAKGIRTGAVDTGDIVPMIEVIETVAAKVPELATDLARIRTEWSHEHLSNMDVAADLQHNAKRFSGVEAPSVKGPEVETPMAQADQSRGR